MVKKMSLFQEARRYFPGGVNSPVRSFKAVNKKPIFIKSAKGVKVTTFSGKTYLDYCMSWGTLIFGHSPPYIIKSVSKQLNLGTSYGFTNSFEIKLAEKICKAIPSIEMIRFVNSGSEATMSAVRLAQGYTCKNKIVKFEGCYHGSSNLLLEKENIFSTPYNDLKIAARTIKKHYNEIACIIVEPIPANMGVVLSANGFLEKLRELCNQYNIVLIFDEVVTGFRLTFGGYQNILDIKPDLTCLGKIIGGGFPVGAYGGKKEIMRMVSPEGSVYQAGTFSGNPITMTAGIKTLEKLQFANYKLLNDKIMYLCTTIENEARNNNVDVQVNRVGSMFSIFFTKEKVDDYFSVKRQNVEKFKRFYSLVFNRGILFSPSPFETNFASFAHTNIDIEKTIKVISYALRRI